MMNKLKLYMKIAAKLFGREVIGNEDYRREYDKVAKTYIYWLQEMGRFTDKIIKPEYITHKKKIKILDFACGTGYITKKLLEKNIDCEITAVDISEKMLEDCKDLAHRGIRIINMDGTEFLENTDEKFDIIFCGWALPYFNHKNLLKLFQRVLHEKGIVGVIANSQGTLQGMEEIFMKVMEENQQEIVKPMDIRFHLPKGKEGLEKWFYDQKFTTLEAGEGEVIFSFNSPEKLLDWLNETGAGAGTAQIFRDYDRVKGDIIEEIRKQRVQNGQYVINHKFTYGIFRCA